MKAITLVMIAGMLAGANSGSHSSPQHDIAKKSAVDLCGKWVSVGFRRGYPQPAETNTAFPKPRWNAMEKASLVTALETAVGSLCRENHIAADGLKAFTKVQMIDNDNANIIGMFSPLDTDNGRWQSDILYVEVPRQDSFAMAPLTDQMRNSALCAFAPDSALLTDPTTCLPD